VSAATLYLVRHGKATASFAEAHDPGLDPLGVAQAEALAARLGPLGPLALVTSPLRRTRETAVPLERLWGRQARVEPAVAEVPSPGIDLARRGEWLRGVMASRWSGVDEWLRRWREEVVGALLAMDEPSVVVTHYVAINVAVGHALGDDRVISFAPDNCSVTVLEVARGALRLVARGPEAVTEVR
jgi:broad specificity phosphatase PhoE